MNIFKCYVCIKQHDIKDCGAACLATISKQYVLKIPISKIREAAGTDKQETRTYGLIKAAEKLGFTAKGVKCICQVKNTPNFNRIFLHLVYKKLSNILTLYPFLRFFKSI
nr:cysteine peptidase family C39 domain-containing protein [Thermoanaerobacterium sp. PSU-2]